MDNRTLVGNQTQRLETPPAGDRTMVVGSGGGLDAQTQMGVALTCPVCQTQNAWGTDWCGECGFKLDAAPGSAPAPDASLPPAQLTGAQGETFPLQHGVNTLGRQDTTVLLRDPTVSRQHAQITLDENGVWIDDLGSSNGTKVDGNRVEPGSPVELRDGSSLKVGGVELTFQVNESAGVVEDEASAESEDLSDAEDSSSAVPEATLLPMAEGEAVEESPTAELSAEGETDIEGTADESGPRFLLPSGAPFVLPEGSTTVGRRETNDLVISDAYTSGAHARIEREGDAVTLYDLHSTNGTLVNSVRLAPEEPTPLQDGDVILFGQSQVIFSLPSEV